MGTRKIGFLDLLTKIEVDADMFLYEQQAFQSFVMQFFDGKLKENSLLLQFTYPE
jgi:hypothetical protein